MDPLSSPLETLILSYRGITSLTTVSHLWTWVAILTAAISLWKFKAAAAGVTYCGKTQHTQKPPSPENPTGRKQQHHPQPPQTPCPRTTPSDAVSATSGSVSQNGSLSFGRFDDWREEDHTLFAKMARNGSSVVSETGKDDSDSVSEMGRVGCVLCDEGRGKFAVYYDGDGRDGVVKGFSVFGLGGLVDGAVSCRLAPLTGRWVEWPWYRHLDLTALNGNVVRLWDDVACRKPPVDWASRPVVKGF